DGIRAFHVTGVQTCALPISVVNFDLPRSPADYVHRIGRTARAGESGVAVSFVVPQSEPHMRLIEKRLGMQLAREVVPGFEPRERSEERRVGKEAGGRWWRAQ